MRDDTIYCAVEGCGRKRKKNQKGVMFRLCDTHQRRKVVHGDAYEDVPITPGCRPLAERRAELQGSE